jgi:hypothetical protein
MTRRVAKRMRLESHNKRPALDTLGRSNENKRGPKKERVYTTEEKDALNTFGKYARLNGWVVETLDYLHMVDELVKI